MISRRIKLEIENSPVIKNITGVNGVSGDWSTFTRTVFERIARKINQVTTQKIIDSPNLVKDFLLLGQDEFENIKFKFQLTNTDDFVDYLKNVNNQKPYKWISGKTLQGYWNNSNAKDKKLNVLLAFLGVGMHEWDEWKSVKPGQTDQTRSLGYNKFSDNETGTLKLLRKYFTGFYHRYFQKPDGKPILIKAPLVIREDPHNTVVIETKTLGHRYKSSYMIIRDGALYVECENIDWNEKETFIFNIGFEINPEVIMGVSNTLNRKSQAIAIKNVLIKQNQSFNYKGAEAVEIGFDDELDKDSDEAKMVAFFRQSGDNTISTFHCHSLDELIV